MDICYHGAVASVRWKQPRRNWQRPARLPARELIAAAGAGHPGDQRLWLFALAPGSGGLLGAIVVATAGHGRRDRGLALQWQLLHLSTAGSLAAGDEAAVRQMLAVALLEQALAAGVSSCRLQARPADLPELLAVGWDLRPLGLALAGSVAPFCITVNHANLAYLRGLVAGTTGPAAAAGKRIGGEVALAS